MVSKHMRFGSRFFSSAMASLLVAAGLGRPPLASTQRESEPELLARTERETNPIKRAKLETVLGRLKLSQAIDAYDKGDPSACQRLLDGYLDRMRQAWDLLRATGRNAVKRPQGFRELDIALRENHRLIDDFAHRIRYTDREGVDKVLKQSDAIHNDVLAALFPPIAAAPPQAPKRYAFDASGTPSQSQWPRWPHGPAWIATSLRLAEPLSVADPAPSRKKSEYLTDDEQDKLREEQDPGARLLLYVQFAQARLDLFTNFRAAPADPAQYKSGKYLDDLLGQYVAIDDEMKDWIEDQYDRAGDMRKGLHALIEQGPRQLEQLQSFEQRPDQFSSEYQSSLHDAIDDINDTIDGATQALATQEKKLGELQREQKVQQQTAKVQAKEEKKRSKEEKKLQKKERKKSGESDDDD